MTFFVVMMFSCFVRGQTITLPLEGYYRPGAFMPVAHAGASAGSLAAGYGVAVEWPARAGVAPVMVLGTTSDRILAGNQELPLRALGSGDRLIGITGADRALAQELFPSSTCITVSLSATDPLPGPALAWDSLDAIIVDAIDPKSIAPLLATGMTIAVKTEPIPDAIWPWKRIGNAWVIHPPRTSESPGLAGEEAYLPVSAWSPSRPPAVRQFIVLLGVLCACMMLGIALTRSRRTLPSLALFALVFCVGFEFWRRGRSEVLTTVRERRIEGDITQIDRWTFQTTPIATEVTTPLEGITWPVFASRSHWESLKPTLVCDESGYPVSIRYTLPANGKMALLRRTITTGSEN